MMRRTAMLFATVMTVTLALSAATAKADGGNRGCAKAAGDTCREECASKRGDACPKAAGKGCCAAVKKSAMAANDDESPGDADKTRESAKAKKSDKTTARIDPARRAPAEDGAPRVSPSDRCPVCAMSIPADSKWAASLTLKNGDAWYFCAPKCVLKTTLRPDKYLGLDDADAIDKVRVMDYYSVKPIDARAAVYVIGSDTLSPMGHDAVPFAKTEQAETFRKRHGGEAPLAFDDLTIERLMSLTNPNKKKR